MGGKLFGAPAHVLGLLAWGRSSFGEGKGRCLLGQGRRSRAGYTVSGEPAVRRGVLLSAAQGCCCAYAVEFCAEGIQHLWCCSLVFVLLLN